MYPNKPTSLLHDILTDAAALISLAMFVAAIAVAYYMLSGIVQ